MRKYYRNMVKVCRTRDFSIYIRRGNKRGEYIGIYQRFDAGEATCALTYQDFIDDNDTSDVVRLLGMDVAKFWHLVLFAYDYASGLCSHGVDEEEGGYDMMWKLIERDRRIVNNETPPPLNKKSSILATIHRV